MTEKREDAEKFWRETWGIDPETETTDETDPVPAEDFHAESQTGGWQVTE
jgi:hypothetical protein